MRNKLKVAEEHNVARTNEVWHTNYLHNYTKSQSTIENGLEKLHFEAKHEMKTQKFEFVLPDLYDRMNYTSQLLIQHIIVKNQNDTKNTNPDPKESLTHHLGSKKQHKKLHLWSENNRTLNSQCPSTKMVYLHRDNKNKK